MTMKASRRISSLHDSFSLLRSNEHLGIVTCSLERVLTANDAFLKMTGFTRQEMDSGHFDWKKITPPESLVRDEEAVHELRERGACFPFEKEYVLRDGTHVPVLLGAMRYSTEPLEWLCWITDLRPQKARVAAEQRAHELQIQLEAELRGARLIYEVSNRLLRKASVPELLGEILDVAIELTEADFGTLQLADDGHYRIVSQRGFSTSFISFFDEVSHDSVAACGAALRKGARVIIEDVMTDDLFAGTPARDMLLTEGVRAVQATPLVGPSAEIYGVLSTHFGSPGRPSDRALRYLDLLASQAAVVLEGVQCAEALRRAEGLKASGRLANALAHEINNPVQALTNVLTLLSEHDAVFPHGQPLVQVATEQLRRVSETARKMLAVDFGQAAEKPKLSKLVEHMREEGGFGK